MAITINNPQGFSYQAPEEGEYFKIRGNNYTLMKREGNVIKAIDIPHAIFPTDAERAALGNSGSQTAAALPILKQKYGVDFSSIPELTGDFMSYGGGGLERIGQGFYGGQLTLESLASGIASAPKPIGGTVNLPALDAATQNYLATAQKQGVPLAQANLSGVQGFQQGIQRPAYAQQPIQQPIQQPAQTSIQKSIPLSQLQPGQTGESVKQLQQYLVDKGLMTQEQMNTGVGIYGPQTKAAVAKFQEQLGIDTAGYAGYWGPKTIAALQQGGQTGGQTATGGSGFQLASAIKNPAEVINQLGDLGVKNPSQYTNAYTDPVSAVKRMVQDVMDATGLPEVKKQMEEINSEKVELENQKADEIAEINDNPWLSEGMRARKIDSINGKFDAKINNKIAEFNLMQGIYDDARQQAQYAANLGISLFQSERAFQEGQAEFLMSQAEKIASARSAASQQDFENKMVLANYNLAQARIQGDVYSAQLAADDKILTKFEDSDEMKNLQVRADVYHQFLATMPGKEIADLTLNDFAQNKDALRVLAIAAARQIMPASSRIVNGQETGEGVIDLATQTFNKWINNIPANWNDINSQMHNLENGYMDAKARAEESMDTFKMRVSNPSLVDSSFKRLTGTTGMSDAARIAMKRSYLTLVPEIKSTNPQIKGLVGQSMNQSLSIGTGGTLWGTLGLNK